MADVTDSDEKIIGRRDGAVGHVIFNNTARHNAVSLDMWHAMSAVLDDFLAEEELRVVVVSGAGGKAFVSGADISKFATERATKEGVAAYASASAAAYDKLYQFPKPTIAKIQGYCLGGGVNLALCCDLRLCNQGARFAIPAAKLGLGYGYSGLTRPGGVSGPARAPATFFAARPAPARCNLSNFKTRDSQGLLRTGAHSFFPNWVGLSYSQPAGLLRSFRRSAPAT